MEPGVLRRIADAVGGNGYDAVLPVLSVVDVSGLAHRFHSGRVAWLGFFGYSRLRDTFAHF